MGVDLEQGESSGKNIEGKIRKVVQAPPKFDATQQNNFCDDTQRALERTTHVKNCNAQCKRVLEEAHTCEELQHMCRGCWKRHVL
jgi:hypothetical protein